MTVGLGGLLEYSSVELVYASYVHVSQSQANSPNSGTVYTV